ncbi:hypothetical protein KR100_07010 [Synechococcus sp. KORDI-100]|nr:hypothetical protein KR100_07010 [Synechococcus sp. KORDI-100]
MFWSTPDLVAAHLLTPDLRTNVLLAPNLITPDVP